MFSDERKNAILNLLSKQQRILVTDVAEALGVSETTVRRDLQDLEEQALLKRTHGGAVPIELTTFEPSVQEKSELFTAEKQSIGQLATTFISPGDAILLDAGTTTLAIARQLPDIDLTVATNSLEIAQELSRHKRVATIVIGGELRHTTGSLVGSFTELLLQHFNADKFFLGANGIHLNRGITTANSTEASAKRFMMAAARETYLVADHSKFNQIHMVQICELGDIDLLLTDAALPSDLQIGLRAQGVEIVSAQA